jgi:nucleoside diphosphate kinase
MSRPASAVAPNVQYTLALIKPDVFSKYEEIIEKIQKLGFIIVQQLQLKCSKEKIVCRYIVDVFILFALVDIL